MNAKISLAGWRTAVRYSSKRQNYSVRYGRGKYLYRVQCPKALILSALAGCTAIDVVDLLNKMRVQFSDFKIDVEGELSEEHPKIYHTVTLTYYIKLNSEDDKSKMEKAVNLSQEKYCGVSAMVKKFADLKVHTVYL